MCNLPRWDRFYDPTIGRFVTQDTNVGLQEDPQSLNEYIYARDNPMHFVDPNGHDWLSSVTNNLVGIWNGMSTVVSTIITSASRAVNQMTTAVSRTVRWFHTVGSRIVNTVTGAQRQILHSLFLISHDHMRKGLTRLVGTSRIIASALSAFAKNVNSFVSTIGEDVAKVPADAWIKMAVGAGHVGLGILAFLGGAAAIASIPVTGPIGIGLAVALDGDSAYELVNGFTDLSNGAYEAGQAERGP